MELSLRLIITSVILQLCFFLYSFAKRRIYARQLPPKFWTFEPFRNFDWTFLTSFNASKYLEYQEKYGKTYRLPTLWNSMNAVVTCEVGNVNAIIAGKDWGVGWRLKGMGELLGVGLITTDGDEWMRARKMMRPAFNRNNIDNLEVTERVADELIQEIENNEGEADMQSLLSVAFTNTSMHFILGLDSRITDDGRPMSASKFNELWLQGLVGMGLRLLLEGKKWLLPKASYMVVCGKLHSFVDFAISKSQERATNASSTGTASKKNMVDTIVPQARDEEDARSQLMHTILANQDTTATLTCNMIQLVGERPDLWKQLRNEVQMKGEEMLTYDALRENKLIHNIQMETLRCRPVFPMLGRRAIRDTVLPTGGGLNGDQPLRIPAGTTGLVNFWSMNFDEDVFGDDVHTFRPERWDTVNPSSKEFIPFGTGGRACLGKEKALADSAFLLVRLVKMFEKLESREKQWKPEARISMRNTLGYKVTFSGKTE